MSSDSDDNDHRNPFRSDDEEEDEEDDEENMEEFQSHRSRQKKIAAKRRRQKDENLYGIFGGVSSSDEEGRSKKERRRGNGKKQQKYDRPVGAPVNFVSSSTTGKSSSEGVQFEKGNEQNRSDDATQKEEEIDETEQQFRQLIGARSTDGGQGGGIGSSNGIGNGNRNQDFRNLVNTAAQLAQEAEATRASAPVLPPPANLAKVGQWEKHTKGFGKKMLEKMGFKGRLGAHESGISAAVEVKVRPGQMGLGFGDFVESTMLEVRSPSVTFPHPSPPFGLLLCRTTKSLKQNC
jgi:tuftelin-interacting protein 11